MTRLTPTMIADVPGTLRQRDRELLDAIGLNLRGLAMRALNIDLDLAYFTAACVPISSGQGVTRGFSESVCAVARHIGIDCHVTTSIDVTGISEAFDYRADIVFMADDYDFVAINTREMRTVNNIPATVLGYCTALEVALGSLENEEVLVIGAGRLGTYAIELLQASRAKVTVVESDKARADAVINRFGVRVKGMEGGLRSSYAILNLSPAYLPGEWINEGSIVSSPGMPYSFDALGKSKIKTLIHDPLQIGVATMAVWSAAYSCVSVLSQHSDPFDQIVPANVSSLTNYTDKHRIENRCLAGPIGKTRDYERQPMGISSTLGRCGKEAP